MCRHDGQDIIAMTHQKFMTRKRFNNPYLTDEILQKLLRL